MRTSTLKDQSKILNLLRFPATVLVIASHCVITTANTRVPLSLTQENLFLFLEQLCLSFGPISVALFSLISGYYLYHNESSVNLPLYIEKLQKRGTSLLLPYVLWNIIALLLLWMKNTIGSKLGLSFAYNQIEYDLISNSNFIDLLLLPIDGPLWYIREIILLIILSPLAYWLMYNKRIGIALLIVLYLCLLFGIEGVKPAAYNIKVHFLLGIYLGIHKIDIPLTINKLWGGYIYILALFYPLLRAVGVESSVFISCEHILLTLSIIGLIKAGQYLYLHHYYIGQKLSSLSSATFFMYSIHWILFINLIRGGLYAIFPIDDTMEKIVVLPMTIICVSWATLKTYQITNKYFPRVTSILCGGRG